MTLEVYLDGALLDSVKLVPGLLRAQPRYLQNVMEELRKTHRPKLKEPHQRLTFFFCGVPSSINSFYPLGK